MNQRLMASLSSIEKTARTAMRLLGEMTYVSFLNDEKCQLAVSMCLVRIGEDATAIYQNNPEFTKTNADIPWKLMRGMRNRIAHDYAEVNLELIWETVRRALPELASIIREKVGDEMAQISPPGVLTGVGALPILPLIKSAFAPFGDVIEPEPTTMRLINSGMTERYHALARAEALGDGASVILNIFRGQVRSFPYSVTMMERHPFGSQSFSPLSPHPFLVVVAQDEGGKPGIPQVFLAKNGQGVNYSANVWHHPLMPLDRISDFLVVDRDGPGNNLEEFFYDDAFVIEEPAR